MSHNFVPANNYTSQEEMERVYSTIAVNLRTEDLLDENVAILFQEVIEAATQTVASYTLRYYDFFVLTDIEWVRRRATIIACFYLSMRRANGTQFLQEYQRIMEELEKFLTDKPPLIPGNDGFPVPVRTSQIPTVSSYIVDDRRRNRKLRVSRDYTTKPYPGQYKYDVPGGLYF